MQITCPQCGTKYRIQADSLGAEGRQVRCKECGQVWQQYPESYVPKIESVDIDTLLNTPPEPVPVPQAIVQPLDHLAKQENLQTDKVLTHQKLSPKTARAKTPPLKTSLEGTLSLLRISFGILLFGVFILTVLAYYPNFSDTKLLRKVYSLVGIQNTNSIAFTDVSIRKNDADYLIECSIKNNNDKENAALPPVRVTLRDSTKLNINRSVLRFPEKPFISPNETVPCKTIKVSTKRYKTLPTLAILDLGNSYDLSLRN